MSLFIDKLKLINKSAPQPMGFQTAKSATPRPQMLLVVSLAQARNLANLSSLVTGADAVLLHSPKTVSGTQALSKLNQSLPDIPWGEWRQDASKEEIEKAITTGCDFLVFPATSSVSATSQNEQVGRILQVEPSLSEGLLRAVNELPVDAVLATAENDEEPALTWHHLMLFQRLANLLTKPLLISVPANTTANEIQSCWEAGAHGIVVTLGPDTKSQVPELRRAIDDLKLLPPRKRVKTDAVLPRISGEAGIVEEVEEEEEDEEE